MADIKLNELNQELSMSKKELVQVKGGAALLLPAIQAAREAANRTALYDGSTITYTGLE